MSNAIFVPEGERLLPTALAGSPWGDELVHGGPVAGLLARAVERFAGAAGMQPARLTVDLFRQVPRAPLATAARTIRAGGRIHVVEASLFAGDVEVSRASAVLLRTVAGLGPQLADQAKPPGPEGLTTSGLARERLPDSMVRRGFHTTVEARWLPTEDGRERAAWLRLPVPLVAGEELSPFVRTASLADFVNAAAGAASSAAAAAPGARAGFINVDISLYLYRVPQGEWLCLEVGRTAGMVGIGLARASLYDEDGPVGAVTQAILANERR